MEEDKEEEIPLVGTTENRWLAFPFYRNIDKGIPVALIIIRMVKRNRREVQAKRREKQRRWPLR
ncbi:MAG: hypothetical protein K5762_07710 [Bacilli bacterium]|nr:hypothetical protein [Bacilli bacterium]